MKTVTFREDEQILLVLHRHWFVILRELIVLLVGLLIAAFLVSSRDTFYPFAPEEIIVPLSNFLLSLFALFLLAAFFAIWVNYYLDVWIITTRRIIDIEQRGLFNREVSEFLISRVQDVTVEVPNFISTMLEFGNMTIQTAGEKNFLVRDIPNLHKAKDLILEYSHRAQEEEARSPQPHVRPQ